MNIDIVVPTFGRTLLLDNCIKSIETSIIDPIIIRLLIINNGDDKQTAEFLKNRTYSKLEIEIFTIAQKVSPGAARNQVFEKLNGEWVLFVDDDAQLPEDYFEGFLSIVAESPSIDIVGGSDCASTKGTYIQRTLNAIYCSPIAMGPTFQRHSPIKKNLLVPASEPKLTLCNLFVKTNFIQSNNLRFPTFLFRNEENYFLNEANNLNAKIYYSHLIKVKHLRRENPLKLLMTFFNSGRGRVKMSLKQMSLTNIVFYTPLVCLFLLLLFFNSGLIKILVLIYLILITLSSLRYSLLFHVVPSLPILVILHPLIHVFYSLGMISCFFSSRAYKKMQNRQLGYASDE